MGDDTLIATLQEQLEGLRSDATEEDTLIATLQEQLEGLQSQAEQNPDLSEYLFKAQAEMERLRSDAQRIEDHLAAEQLEDTDALKWIEAERTKLDTISDGLREHRSNLKADAPALAQIRDTQFVIDKQKEMLDAFAEQIDLPEINEQAVKSRRRRRLPTMERLL